MIIGITGHSRGVGKSIFDELSLNYKVIGFSRSNGYDIQNVKKILSIENEIDVFINNVYYETYQSQILYEFFEKWKDLNKTIININSSSIHQSGAWNPKYVANKKHLNDITQSLIDKYPNKKVRVINLNLGTLDSHNNFSNFNKIECEKVGKVVKWCLEQPQEIEIQQLTILPTTQLKS